MSILSIKELYKAFRLPKRTTSFWRKMAFFASSQYDTKVALDHISFEAQEGELIGYIGPNGAGKSTTVKILSGILTPGSGEVKVLGKIPWKERKEIARHIGVVFGQRTQLWWDLQVIESFELLKAIYAIDPLAYKKKLHALTEALEIGDLLHIPVRMLSLGQRMRCDLAASLLHSPKILFLDEPTIGLDAVSKLAVREFIRSLSQEEKVTIILTTHDMDDIEQLCKRVLLLDQGKLCFDGELENLRTQVLPERRLVIDLSEDYESIKAQNTTFIKKEGRRVYLSFSPKEITTPLLIAEITAKYQVADLFVENPPIEEIIAKLYRRNF